MTSSSAPDDHLAAGPNCRVRIAGAGRVGGAGGCPTIGAGIVSAASVKISCCRHIRPRRSSHCRSKLPCERLGQRARWWCWWLSKLSVPGLYLPPVFKDCRCKSAPDDHLTASPDCCVIDRAAGALVVLVAVQLSVLGLYLPPVLKGAAVIVSAPDDHLSASPDCRVTGLAHRAHWWGWSLSSVSSMHHQDLKPPEEYR